MKAFEKYVTKENIKNIHEASLRILAETGVVFDNDRAIDILEKHGVKTDGHKVFFSEQDVKNALSTVKPTINLRVSADETVELGNGAMLRMPILHSGFCSDENGVIRSMTTEYAIRQFKMGETSQHTNISAVNYAILNDVAKTPEQKIFGAQAFTFKYGNKYFDTHNGGADVNGLGPEKAREYIKQGIELGMRFRGIDSGTCCVSTVNTFSPLAYHGLALEQIMIHADMNQAFFPAPCAMPLLTGPPSLAGLLAMTNSEILAGIVFSQIYKPGTPVMYANTSGSTDMRTIQLCIGSAEAALVVYATAAMADYYKLPFRTGGALSDAKQIDAQAGTESMLMMQATNDVRPDYILHYIGCMGEFNAFSAEKFLLDEETANIAMRLNRGIDTSEDKLAVDLINKIGPKGSFMAGRTPKMYREDFYLSKIFNKDDPNNWQNNGAKSVKDIMNDEVKKRLSSYQPPKLTKEQENIIAPYLPEALKNGI